MTKRTPSSARALNFVTLGSPPQKYTHKYGEHFNSHNELSWATDATKQLPSARLLIVQYDFKTVIFNPVDALVTSFLDLCGDIEPHEAEQTSPIIFVAWGFGRLIVTEAISKATGPELEWFRRSAREILDPESALKLAPEPKGWIPSLHVVYFAIKVVNIVSRNQTSPSPKRVKTTWPVGEGKQINKFLKSLEQLCGEVGIPTGGVSLQRAPSLPTSRKTARAKIDAISTMIADEISSKEGIEVKHCQCDSRMAHDNKGKGMSIRDLINAELQKITTEVLGVAKGLQQPIHGARAIDFDHDTTTNAKPDLPFSQTPSVDFDFQNSERIQSLNAALRYNIHEFSNVGGQFSDSGYGDCPDWSRGSSINEEIHKPNSTHDPAPKIRLPSSDGLDNGHPLAPDPTTFQNGGFDGVGDLLGDYKVSEEGNAFERVQATDGNWSEIQRKLPLELQFNIYFQNNVWVYTGSGSEETQLGEAPIEIPLRIARVPVITMPRIKPFWHSGGESLPDPVPGPADPKSLLDENLTDLIFETYPFAQGFHLFFNGSLQLLVPKDFDKSSAKRMYPQIFAGFHVSFLSTLPIPTATTTVTHTALSTQAPTVSTQPTSIAPSVSPGAAQSFLQCGSKIIVQGRDGRNGPAGRIGVGLRFMNDNRVVFTIASHVAFQSHVQDVRNSWKQSVTRQWRKWRNQPQPYNIELNGLHVLDASTKKQIGTICHSFDRDMGEFPTGYEHDLAYVEPSNNIDVSGIKSSAKKFYLAPNNLGEGRQLYLLCSGADLGHECGQNVTLTPEEFRVVVPAMSVGQFCLKSRLKTKKGSGNAADEVHSRAILYRWFFRSKGPGTTTLAPFSGAALYVKPNSEYGDSETTNMILGFQSFELVSENFDSNLRDIKDYKRSLIRRMDGKIYRGNEAVYGSMIAPRELIEAVRRDRTVIL
ncbi:hypothetical protein K440DRAFT_646726 [Wilcoxina mikolae CBS 423.85]|nr:hypothetical protein K440DRAFT_646726 [Wilcoxina mikolae CBS 423.85]